MTGYLEKAGINTPSYIITSLQRDKQMTQMDGSGSHTVAVSHGTAIALEKEAEESGIDISALVEDLVSDHLKASVDKDVRTDITVEDGVEISHSLTDRQEMMISAIGGDTGVEGFVTSAVETRTESVLESVTIELPGTIIAALDVLVDGGIYPNRSVALQHAMLDEEQNLLDDQFEWNVGCSSHTNE